MRGLVQPVHLRAVGLHELRSAKVLDCKVGTARGASRWAVNQVCSVVHPRYMPNG